MKTVAAEFQHALTARKVADRFARSTVTQRVAAGAKAFIGPVGDTFYAVKIDGVDPSFMHEPLGAQGDTWRAIEEFKKGAKKDWISAKARKGKTLPAEMKRWMQSVHPKEFYAKLNPNDDSHQIFYK